MDLSGDGGAPKDKAPAAGRRAAPRSPLPAIEIARPAQQTAPVVFASPHSGRQYPADFVTQSSLDALALRRSEDAFVDQLFRTAPEHGAPLLCAHFPRAYVDANREAYELDPRMFSDSLPDHVTTRSPRIAAGLGTIARVVANGEEIYHSPLTYAEARKRIEATHRPYHQALATLLAETRRAFGGALLIDCHSMPSNVGGLRGERLLADVVLGDCHGTAAAPAMTALAEHLLKEQGFTVIRNRPYAGGYTTRHYGRPRAGAHALQVEINRALYLDEARIEPLPCMADVAQRLDAFMARLCAGARRLVLPQAAE